MSESFIRTALTCNRDLIAGGNNKLRYSVGPKRTRKEDWYHVNKQIAQVFTELDHDQLESQAVASLIANMGMDLLEYTLTFDWAAMRGEIPQ